MNKTHGLTPTVWTKTASTLHFCIGIIKSNFKFILAQARGEVKSFKILYGCLFCLSAKTCFISTPVSFPWVLFSVYVRKQPKSHVSHLCKQTETVICQIVIYPAEIQSPDCRECILMMVMSLFIKRQKVRLRKHHFPVPIIE